MKFTPIEPPRRFEVTGAGLRLMLSDCARIDLAPDEQVTFTTPGSAEYDVVRKEWGFYATPSTNGRLAAFGLRTALVRNRQNRLFVMLVEKDREAAFHAYVVADRQQLVCWLDTDADVERLCNGLGLPPP